MLGTALTSSPLLLLTFARLVLNKIIKKGLTDLGVVALTDARVLQVKQCQNKLLNAYTKCQKKKQNATTARDKRIAKRELEASVSSCNVTNMLNAFYIIVQFFIVL